MVIIFSLDLILLPIHNFKQFNIKAAAAHHTIVQKEVNELLAKVAIEPSSGVLVSIMMCLLFLSILVVSSPCLTLNGLIIICTSLLLRCLLLDIYGNLFNVVTLLSPLISGMLIYISVLLSIIIVFMICLVKYAI